MNTMRQPNRGEIIDARHIDHCSIQVVVSILKKKNQPTPECVWHYGFMFVCLSPLNLCVQCARIDLVISQKKEKKRERDRVRANECLFTVGYICRLAQVEIPMGKWSETVNMAY